MSRGDSIKQYPKVSIILTSFNHDEFIEEAIDSILSQTYSDYELIIWDDASTDRSWEIINSYKDARIRSFRNDLNNYYVINQALAAGEVKGEYIAIHHSDDTWKPTKLQKQVSYLDEHKEIGAVFTHAHIIDEQGKPFTNEGHYYFSVFEQPNRSRHEWLKYFFSTGNALCHPSVLIRKECYANCGVYRYGLAQMPDFDMWVRLCMKYEIFILDEKLTGFRVRDNELNTSGDKLENRSRGFFEYYTLLKNYIKIKDREEFVCIFPSAEKHLKNDDLDTSFALAMMLIEEGSTLAHRFLGIEILFELMEDGDLADTIKQHYGIDCVWLIEVTAKYGIPYLTVSQLEQELLSRDMKIQHLDDIEAEKNAALAQLQSIHGSVSWRITSPLRALRKILK